MNLSLLLNHVQGNSLFSRCFRGGAMLAVGSVLERGMRFARNMILARLLAPEHFGLMALVLASSMLFEALTEVGVRQAVVQSKEGANKDYLNVVWWFSLLRGLVLYMVGWLVSPLAASFYHEPALTSLLRAAFLVLLLRGFTSPSLYVLEKQLKFGKVIIVTQGAGIFGTLISLVLSFYYPNTWSLVIGFITEALFCSVGSFFIYSFLPKKRIDRWAAKELFRFSRGMMGLPVLTYLFVQADIFVMGRLCSKEILGHYYLALALAVVPQMLFTRIAGRMILPVFSEMQENKQRLRTNLLWMTQILFLFGLPLVLFLNIFAQPILSMVYGGNYGQVHTAFAVLNIYMLFYMAGILIASVYLSVGRPGIHRSFTVLRLVLLAISIYPAVLWFGPIGAATAKLMCLILAGIWQLFSLKKLLDLPIRQYLEMIIKGLLLAGTISIPAFAWRWWIDLPWLQIAGGAVLCSLAWLKVIWSLRGEIKSRISNPAAMEAAN